MIKATWVKPTLHIFTKGRFGLEMMPNGEYHIYVDMSEEELNQMAYDILVSDNLQK